MQDERAPGGTTFLMAAACGLIAANLYYAQTLVGPIGHQLGIPPQSTGLIVTMTQIGYCSGLLLVVPLADLLENRRLVVGMTLACAVALVLLALAVNPTVFFAASYLVGLASVSVQILVPFAAHLAPEERRGRDVGRVMSGLMSGIMLARPVASGIAQVTDWRFVFWFSAFLMLLCAGVLWKRLPSRRPEGDLSYFGLVRSMAHLFFGTPVLLQRGFYHAFMFGAFSVFWTAVPLYLAAAPLSLSQGQIALFSLAGAAGVIAAPLAGAQADKGRLVAVTVGSMLIVALAFLISPWSGGLRLPVLVAAAIGIDFGVTANLVVSQREIFSLGPEVRSRLNGLFIALFFLGGAAGSALGAYAYDRGGWVFTSHVGAALPTLAMLAYALVEGAKKLRRARPTAA